MGKNIEVSSWIPKVRPKSASFTPKQEEKHPHHFDMGAPAPPHYHSQHALICQRPLMVQCSPANKQAPADKPVLYQKQNEIN